MCSASLPNPSASVHPCGRAAAVPGVCRTRQAKALLDLFDQRMENWCAVAAWPIFQRSADSTLNPLHSTRPQDHAGRTGAIMALT